MLLTEQITDFLNKSIKLTSSSIIYLTDLDNVVYIATKNKINNVNVPSAINKELLKVFLKSNTDNAETLTLNNDTINIFEDIALNPIWKSQIILPIIIDDSFYGTLVFASNNETNIKHVEFAETTQRFVIDMIIHNINQNHLLKDIYVVENTSIFCEDNLSYITTVLDNKSELLDNENIFLDIKNKISEISSFLDDTLSDEYKEKLEELHYWYFKQKNCECYLSYLIGLKTGMKINNL